MSHWFAAVAKRPRLQRTRTVCAPSAADVGIRWENDHNPCSFVQTRFSDVKSLIYNECHTYLRHRLTVFFSSDVARHVIIVRKKLVQFRASHKSYISPWTHNVRRDTRVRVWKKPNTFSASLHHCRRICAHGEKCACSGMTGRLRCVHK